MGLNVVSSYAVSGEFKKSRYFRQNLGLVATIEKNGRRVFNDKDKFNQYYNTQYRTIIYAQGNVGDIRFYADHFIKDNTFAVYQGEHFEEFLFKYDFELVNEKGIDFYLGHILKSVEEQYEERVRNEELKKLEPKPEGNPDLLTSNPGNVTYADVKAYLDKKQKERYKNI